VVHNGWVGSLGYNGCGALCYDHRLALNGDVYGGTGSAS
jgi:hypothetical protein